MELPGEEGEMPLPINSTYGAGHMIHHEPAPRNHIVVPSSTITNSSTLQKDHPMNVPYKKMVRYRECLKNHAASMGANATDGCGEFMPSGEEGSLEALTCSACNCHRNFHRKEIEGELPLSLTMPMPMPMPMPSSCDCYGLNRANGSLGGRKVIMGHHKGILGTETFGYTAGGGTLVPSRAAPAHQMIMSYNMGGCLASESDEQEDGRPRHHLVKKRFRTKFSHEQKEKMLDFAEKVGWKIQKQEESVVQQFCQEVGVKRRVLKVWMHNNKHNLANKNPSSSINAQNQI